MNAGRGRQYAKENKQPEKNKGLHAKRWAFLRRTPSFLNWFEAPKILKIIKPYIKEGHVIADIGCGWGYYTFLLADLVGSLGKVYSVDLGEKCIQSIQKKAIRLGNKNIEGKVTTAADLGFIDDKSVDFVFANGLLCSMENDRGLAVGEIIRILKPKGIAYISLGAKPPFGLVDETEWSEMLSKFNIEQGGIYNDLWVVVSSPIQP